MPLSALFTFNVNLLSWSEGGFLLEHLLRYLLPKPEVDHKVSLAIQTLALLPPLPPNPLPPSLLPVPTL